MWMHKILLEEKKQRGRARKSPVQMQTDFFPCSLALTGFLNIIISPDKVFCLPLLAAIKVLEHG